MFLDAALGLYLFGTLAVAGVALLSLAAGAAIGYGIWLRRRGRNMHALLVALPAAVVLTSLAVLSFRIFLDHRTDKQIVLDLRKSQHDFVTELKKYCPLTDLSFCDSVNRKLHVLLIFADGSKLRAYPESMFWHGDEGKVDSIIIMRKSIPLQAGFDLLEEHAAMFVKESDSEAREKVRVVGEWVLHCCKNNVVYSERSSVQLRPQLLIQFRKNVDEVSLDYVITPNSSAL